MDNPFFMRAHNVFRQQETLGNVLADFACHIIALHAVYGRVFIGIFLLYFFVIALNQAEYLFIRRIRFAYQRPLITICNIISCNIKGTLVHNLIFYQVLDFLYIQRPFHPFTDFSHII